jgi:environmental stress-induced protein Ves
MHAPGAQYAPLPETSMRYEIIKKADNHVHEWTGGSTAEIFIYPPGARYADRNFELRISSALVELDDALFSDFTGFVRHIMPIEGAMRLFYDGGRDILLQPYEADTLDGALATRSIGKCTDFNLIHRPGWQGRIAPLAQPGSVSCLPGAFTGVFARINDLAAEGTGKGGRRFSATLQAGDFLMLKAGAGERCTLALAAPAGRTGVPGVLVEALRTAG